jgi:predicted N-acetyltransferase YhbS
VPERIESLRAADFDEAMDFMDLVFSAAYRPHDFARLLPALYRPTDRHMGCNLVVRRRGRIAALVGVFPLEWRLGAVTLRVAGIGGVCTHPRHRNSGLMAALMRHALAAMRREGHHASWLGGQRQRYEHYGYTPAGFAPVYTVTRKNAQAMPAPRATLRFAPLASDDAEGLRRARALHDAQPVRAVRHAGDFPLRLRSWHHQPHAALGTGGRMLGYVVANESGDFLAEVRARDGDTALALVREWVLQRPGDAVSVEPPPLDLAFGRRLGRYAEQVQVRPCGNWQVFDWPAVVGALLQARHAVSPLPEGAVALAAANGPALRLEVRGPVARCEAAEAAPDLVLPSAGDLTRLLFGPVPPAWVTPLPPAAAVLEAWCPLPARWPTQDGV